MGHCSAIYFHMSLYNPTQQIMSATRRISRSKSATRRKRGGGNARNARSARVVRSASARVARSASARSARRVARDAMNATRPRSNPMNATRPNASAPPLSPLAIASAPPLYPSAPPLSPVVMNVHDLESAPPQLPEDIAPAQYQLMVHQIAMVSHNNYLSILNLQREVEDIKNSLTILNRHILPGEEM